MSETKNSMERIKRIKSETKEKIGEEIERLFSEKMKTIRAINSKEAFELFCAIEAMKLCLFRQECKNNPELMSCFYKEANIDDLNGYVVSAFRDVFYEIDKETLLKKREPPVSQKVIAFCIGAICGAIGMTVLFFYFAGHCL